jgi:hypothetical protein
VIGLFGRATLQDEISELLETLEQLDSSSEDRRRASAKLFESIAGGDKSSFDSNLIEGICGLAQTADEKRSARESLIILLSGQAKGNYLAWSLTRALAQLDPVATDLSTWQTWETWPTPELLVAARMNSDLDSWLANLNLLAPLSAEKAQESV